MEDKNKVTPAQRASRAKHKVTDKVTVVNDEAIKHSADTDEAVDVVSQNGDRAVNFIKTGIKFVPSTRVKLFASCVVTGIGFGLTLRYFALDSLERAFTSEEATEFAEKAAHHIQPSEAS